MSRITLLAGLAVLLIASGPALAVSIDHFVDGDFNIEQPVPPTATTYTSTDLGALILGGERETTLYVASGTGQTVQATVDNIPGPPVSGIAHTLLWSEGDSIKGTLKLLYDGVGTAGVGANTDGLGNVDLTNAGASTGFDLMYGQDGDGSKFQVTITVVSGIGEASVQTSTYSTFLLGHGFALLPFTSFTGTANFAAVDSVTYMFDSDKGGFNPEGYGGGDYSFDLLGTSNVPEPLTMAGLILGVGCLGRYVRRRAA